MAMGTELVTTGAMDMVWRRGRLMIARFASLSRPRRYITRQGPWTGRPNECFSVAQGPGMNVQAGRRRPAQGAMAPCSHEKLRMGFNPEEYRGRGPANFLPVSLVRGAEQLILVETPLRLRRLFLPRRYSPTSPWASRSSTPSFTPPTPPIR